MDELERYWFFQTMYTRKYTVWVGMYIVAGLSCQLDPITIITYNTAWGRAIIDYISSLTQISDRLLTRCYLVIILLNKTIWYVNFLGVLQVILRDKNVDESSSWVKQPSASVRVVEPSYLQLKVVPPQGPALVTSRPAAVAASAYDASHNRIFLTEVFTHIHAYIHPVHCERKWNKEYPLYCTISFP